MKKTNSINAAAMVVFAAFVSLALLTSSRPTWAANAAPLGLEIGVATHQQVKQQLGKSTELVDRGPNKYTDGKMLSGGGAGLDIAGLKQITFIFDRDDVLQGVVMTLEKDFRTAFDRLRKKYKVVSQQIPFVGNSSAKFAQGNSAILLDAPHLSFEMTLSYLSNGLLAAFKSQSNNENAKKEREQQDRL